ncbi:CheR family methyltransferase [Arenimonas sp. MALMAid1274]|uniref:CheR family methyltransferase n=1 Tax=Arenimonas sp. MALMAid1274 TaxID=3411630 RepID=UPI003B9E2F6B
MSRAALLDLLQTRLGLDPGTLGARVVDDAFADARRALAAADDAALYRKVLLDAEAFGEFCECFVVPETWFFRAAEQFQDLARHAREQPARRPLRVLSLPSSTGEEAYSAAITLLEAGLAPADIDVLGIDVSQAAIRRAQAGVFRRSALRGQPVPTPWLHEAADGSLQADPVLRRCVRFRVGNALDPGLLRAEDPFDVVFCRNLLIYLHPEARGQLLHTLLSASQVPALVLAGQAEVLSSMSDALQPYEGGCPLSFIHGGPRAAASVGSGRSAAPRRQATGTMERLSSTGARSRSVPAPAREPAPAVPRGDATSQGGAPPRERASVPLVADAVAAPDDAIRLAHDLADAGHVDQARAACLLHLARQPADVAALYLLGLLESASGHADAADRAFTQVLYLDRNHLDAIEQRIGLAERRGAGDQARDLRARAARLRQRHREASP